MNKYYLDRLDANLAAALLEEIKGNCEDPIRVVEHIQRIRGLCMRTPKINHKLREALNISLRTSKLPVDIKKQYKAELKKLGGSPRSRAAILKNPSGLLKLDARKTIGESLRTSVARADELWRPASSLRAGSQSDPWQTVSGQELEQFLLQINMIDQKYEVDPATTLVSWTELPFYQNVVLIRVHDPIWINRDLIVYYLSFASSLYRLNGTSPPIHEVNSKAPIELNTANAIDYLKFFCFFVRGEEGPFYVLESLNDPLLPQEMDDNTRLIIETTAHPVEILEQDEPEVIQLKSFIFYSNALFHACFRVEQNGMISMFNDEPVAAELSYKINAPIV